MDTIWNGMDQATLDRGYDARASVDGYEAETAVYAAAWAAVAWMPHAV